MDVAALTYYFHTKEERLTQKASSPTRDILIAIFSILFTVVISVWAIGASWECSTIQRVGFPMKVVYAAFSAVFPAFYLILRALGVFQCPTPLI